MIIINKQYSCTQGCTVCVSNLLALVDNRSKCEAQKDSLCIINLSSQTGQVVTLYYDDIVSKKKTVNMMCVYIILGLQVLWN